MGESENKMTKREFYEAVITAAVNDEITDFAQKAIEQLDLTNEKRKVKAAEKRVDNSTLVNAIVELTTSEPKTASMLLEDVTKAGLERLEEGKSWNVQYISFLARKGVEAGALTQTEVKIKGKGVQKAYVRA